MSLCVLLGWLAGCQDPPPEPAFRGFTGEIVAIQPEMAELQLRLHPTPPDMVGMEGPATLVAREPETELYINDQLAELTDVRVGDVARVTGYVMVETPGVQRIVISLLEVYRTLPQPPMPDLPPPSGA